MSNEKNSKKGNNPQQHKQNPNRQKPDDQSKQKNK